MALIFFLTLSATPSSFAADDAKPTSLEELDKLPVALKVVHSPTPALATENDAKDRPKYRWWFQTTVSSVESDVTIVEFGAYHWLNDKWVFGNFTGKPFSGKDFSEWYSCPDAIIKEGKSFTDPTNWASGPKLVAGKARWYFIGVDKKGRRVKGEAIVELKGEIDPKRPKEK
jgi:hypothetical protein